MNPITRMAEAELERLMQEKPTGIGVAKLFEEADIITLNLPAEERMLVRNILRRDEKKAVRKLSLPEQENYFLYQRNKYDPVAISRAEEGITLYDW